MTDRGALATALQPNVVVGPRAELVNKQLDVLLRAKYPLVYVITWEEDRVTREIKRVLADRVPLRCWSSSRGFADTPAPARDQLPDAISALDELLTSDDPGVYLFYDFHAYLGKQSSGRALFSRKLRDVAAAFRRSRHIRTLVLMSPAPEIPDELEKDITILDYPLPEVEEIEAVVESVLSSCGGEYDLDRAGKESLFRGALGLTSNEVENVFTKSLVASGNRIDAATVQCILEEKMQIIRKSGMLEYYEVQEQFDSIGGLDLLKEWLHQRAKAFSEEARRRKIPEPKGILLVGVPGCGKSLSAKAVAQEWRQPLLRLDIGKIFGGIVGASEENMRRCIKVAESVSPAVLWLDEIEKGFAGLKSSGDSGVTARVFGTFLTWMQEKTVPVFVIATANDISKLPPELLRKGRFDEIFFVDLPSRDELRDIFRIHLSYKELPPDQFDLDKLAARADGFTGAEVEQAVISSLYDAFNLSGPLSTEGVEKCISATFPLSKTMDTEITALRRWAEKRARPASRRGIIPPVEPPPPVPTVFKIPFRLGMASAKTVGEFLPLCHKDPIGVRELIRNGRLERWLRNEDLDELANAAKEAQEVSDPDYMFTTFMAAAERQLAPAESKRK